MRGLTIFVLCPRLTVHSLEDFLDYWDRSTATGLVRIRREPISVMTMAVMLGLGAVGTGTGIASWVTSSQNYAQLSVAIDADIQEIQSGMQNLKDSVASLAEMVLQNRRGLDLLFLQQGGLCAALKEECCFYSDKLGLVENSLQKVRESLDKRRREREESYGWFEGWFFKSPWLTTLLSAIAGPLAIIMLLFTIGPCIINRFMAFLKRRMDSIQMFMLQQQYVALRNLDDR